MRCATVANASNARRWRAFATTGPPSAGGRQEELLEIVEEVEAERRRLDALQVAADQAAPFGFGKRSLDGRCRQAGTLAKGRDLEAFLQAQRIEHELERQVGA